MKIKEILRNDKSLLNYYIEVNGEQYDECKHGDLIHIDTEIETQEEYSNILDITIYRPKVKFTAIAKDKILKLLEKTLKLLESEDIDTSLSDYMDKRIKEIAEE